MTVYPNVLSKGKPVLLFFIRSEGMIIGLPKLNVFKLSAAILTNCGVCFEGNEVQ